jgi:hypothetical protein
VWYGTFAVPRVAGSYFQSASARTKARANSSLSVCTTCVSVTDPDVLMVTRTQA